MAVRAKVTNLRVIDEIVNRLQVVTEDCIVEVLTKKGRQYREEARNGRGYVDRSGDLGKSTGFVLFKNNNAISSYFPERDGEPARFGRQVAEQMLKGGDSDKTHFDLMLVAGMPYAWYVENIHGKSVTATAELMMMGDRENIVEEIRQLISQRLNK